MCATSTSEYHQIMSPRKYLSFRKDVFLSSTRPHSTDSVFDLTKKQWRRGVGRSVAWGGGYAPSPEFFNFKIVHSVAFSYTNSKVLFAIKCRERYSLISEQHRVVLCSDIIMTSSRKPGTKN